jgi:hypothetical protein
MFSNMKAEALMDERHVLDERSFVEIVIWLCVLRYDNEVGKGDHMHIDDKEEPYAFTTYDALLTDFWSDVEAWRSR